MNYTAIPTESSPRALFDAKSGEFTLSGKSYWENANVIFDPMIKWLDEVYLPNPAAHTRFDIRLDYYNTSSTFALISVLRKLETLVDAGYLVTVFWHYHEQDTDVHDTGMDIRNITRLKVELVSFSE